MPQVVLDQTKIIPLICQIEPAGMPQRVGMDIFNLTTRSRTADQIINGLPCQWLPPLADENQGNASARVFK